MSSRSSNEIKAAALELGFSACGIAPAEPVDAATQQLFHEWLSEGSHGDMGYMANHVDKRLDPRELMPGVKSIICVSLNYAPKHRIPDSEPQLAVYAYGHDYHDVMKEKLHQLAQRIGAERYRAFCDTAPVLERHWAVRSGFGWIGKNHLLIIPFAGSMFFLGELFVDFECEYDSPLASRCGNCRRCVDACPNHALSLADGGMTRFDARRCLSYLTIENRGALPEGTGEKMGHTIYGCDRCQDVCPWNRFSRPTDEPQLQPSEELLGMTAERWQTLSEEEWRRLFKGSAVKRAKYEGLMRNIREANEAEHK
ncbi:MAG: tRNA epoxyqueuosine(34) reductase QueG [Prevotella sp.]|nr:tRNA epoxyqueuosine(34) reductase QueG [Prevotella sp.]